MMKSVVICEGNTDLTIIQYFLEKVYNWQFIKNDEHKKYGNIIHKYSGVQNVKWFKHFNGSFLCIISAGIEQCRTFIDNIDSNGKYLCHRRKKTKAKFDTVFVVRTPSDAFNQRQSLLRSVP